MASPADEALVRMAMELAGEAGERGDPPFGAVLVDAQGAVVARASSRQVSGRDPTAHAEVEAIREAVRGGQPLPLAGWTIGSNAEPCSMCSSLLVKAGITRIVFGAVHEGHMDPDLPLADVLARSRRPPEVLGEILAEEAAAQIAAFRAARPPVD